MSQKEDYILFLTKWYPNYEDPQLGIFVQKHAQLLAENNRVVVIYLCPIWKSSKPKVEYISKGRLEEYIVYYRPFKGILKVLNPYMYYRFQKEVYTSLNGRAKHCFVNIGAKTGFLAYYHLRKKQINYSLMEHWSGFVNGKFQGKPSIKKWFYRKLATKAQNVYAVSEFLREKMKAEFPKIAIQLLPNVIEGSILDLNPENSGKQIIVVGDLVDEIKNISGVINAFKHFIQIHKDYSLVIVGGGPSEEKLKALVKQLNLAETVQFKGRLDNLQARNEIAQSQFLVSNSNFETFGMVCAEALFMGKPVVSTRSGGPEEFLSEENSILIAVQKEDELLNGMLEMVSRLDQFDSKKISRSIHEKFDRDKILNILESEVNPSA